MVRSGDYLVFHDESIPNKRWLLIGLSFCRKDDIGGVRDLLRVARRTESYFGEIHFSGLPKSFDGSYGAKARVARAWMQAFEGGLAGILNFSVLAVDRHSPAYEHRRFTEDFHAYNRFTAMALKAGIAWHIGPKNLDRVNIEFISDAKDRATRPDQGMVDNFEDYLPYRAELDSFLSESSGRSFPAVKLTVQLQDSAQDDLLQFTDLLLGASQMALVGASSRPVKRKLGEFVVRWFQDVQQPPWRQQYGLHRRFSLWAFPDEEGRPYSNMHLNLEIQNGQMQLF
ncbi:MAG: hypothetical protein KatS3mg081_1726 [Gemmatimonadales bacterium]|nr:MAG: hypothetical protein KatS3mg081_1726 [Gemmatimonadales bacterium]